MMSASVPISPTVATDDGSVATAEAAELKRRERLLRERMLGMHSAPLVYDAAMGLRVGKARQKTQNTDERLEQLARRLIDSSTMREESFYQRDVNAAHKAAKIADEQEQQRQEKRQRAVQRGEERRRRVAERDHEERRSREEERKDLERRRERTDMRIRDQERRREEERGAACVESALLRRQRKEDAEELAEEARETAEERARREDERVQEDRELRERRNKERRVEHERMLAEKRQRAMSHSDALQQRRRDYIAAKQAAADRRMEEFRAARSALAEDRRSIGAHRELKSWLIREQRERLRQWWLDEAAAQQEQQQEVQEEMSRCRDADMTHARELSRLRAEDRRCEKERQEAVQRYLSVARLEGQEKKHAKLEAYVEQRRAAAWQIRQDQQTAALRRTRQLARLQEEELKERQHRTFRIHNGLPPPPPRTSAGGARNTPGLSPIQHSRDDDDRNMLDSGINDPQAAEA